MSEIRLYRPDQLDADEWRALQSLEREAYTATLERSSEEIDTLVAWDDPTRFYTSHVDPNSEVGGRYNGDQQYSRPRVAVAINGHELVGFAYSACNVSGRSLPELWLKRLSIAKNYVWMREVAVRPDHQKQGVARQLARKLLQDAMPFQPVATYVSDGMSLERERLEKLGFHETGAQSVSLFGENTAPVTQVRMQAPTVRSVLKKLS